MRTVKYATVERWPRGHYNPHKNLVIRYRGRDVELESKHGARDDVYVWRAHDVVHVLSVYSGLPYVGFAVYVLDARALAMVSEGIALTADEELYYQEGEVEETLGPRGTDLAPATMRKRLASNLAG